MTFPAAAVAQEGQQLSTIFRIHILLDPTPEEVETARTGSLWEVWNSDRSLYLASATGPKGGLFDEEEHYEEPSARG